MEVKEDLNISLYNLKNNNAKKKRVKFKYISLIEKFNNMPVSGEQRSNSVIESTLWWYCAFTLLLWPEQK